MFVTEPIAWTDADTAYRHLSTAFRADLYITDTTHPLPPPTT
jgi:hypothetical protein